MIDGFRNKMTEQNLETRIRLQLSDYVGPLIFEAELVESSESASSSFLRSERRKRGRVSLDEEVLANAPQEHRFVFRMNPQHRELIVIADSTGRVIDAIESR